MGAAIFVKLAIYRSPETYWLQSVITCNLLALSRSGGNLDFRGCKQLKGIFDGLEVEGDFIAWGCQNLQYLPQGTRIEGEASLRGCFGLKNLPDNMRVGYKIWR